MKLRMLSLAIAASLSTAAEAADFIFSFNTDATDPTVANAVPGMVTGRILGLAEQGTSSATQVFIDNYSPTSGVMFPLEATRWFSKFENSFTVMNGQIVGAAFHADNDFGPSLSRLYLNVPLSRPGGTNYASVGSNNASSVWNNRGLSGVTFTNFNSAVPEPSTWAMMLGGFAMVGGAMRSARRKAPTTHSLA